MINAAKKISEAGTKLDTLANRIAEQVGLLLYEPRHEKTYLRPNTHRTVRPMNMARGLKFWV